jgi:hypothetical protein
MSDGTTVVLRQRMVILSPDRIEWHYPRDGTGLGALLTDGWRIVRECPHAEDSTLLILEPAESEEEKVRRLMTGR